MSGISNGTTGSRRGLVLGIVMVVGLLFVTVFIVLLSTGLIARRLLSGGETATVVAQEETTPKIAYVVSPEATDMATPGATSAASPAGSTRPSSPAPSPTRTSGTAAIPALSTSATVTVSTRAAATLSPTISPTASASQRPAPTAYIGASIVAGGTKLTITNAIQRTTTIAQGTALELKANGDFVIFPVKMEGTDNNSNCVRLRLYTQDGKDLLPSEAGTTTYNTMNDLDDLLPSCVDPGEVKNGVLVFEIPSGVNLSRLQMENVAGEGNAIDLSK